MKNFAFAHQYLNLLTRRSDLNIRGTLAVSLPSKKQLLDMVINFERELSIELGLTMCHPKDQFVKAIGRAEALKRVTLTTAQLDRVYIADNRMLFEFYAKHQRVRFSFSVHKNSELVFLEDLRFWRPSRLS